MDRIKFITQVAGIFTLCALLTGIGCTPQKKGTTPLEDVTRLIVPRPSYVMEYFAETQDHWKLALHRYAPEKPDPSRMPVILCHGLGYNGYFWDLDATHNVAEYLRDAGWDVWILDLRGGGDSSKPIWYWLRGPDLAVAKHRDLGFTKFSWSLEDYIGKDVPTAVDFVRKQTGAASVAWVGHSLGGMIGMCHLERAQEAGIGCLVAVASPMIVPLPTTMFQRDFKYVNFALGTINNRWHARAQRLTLGQFKTPLDVYFYNENNMDALTLQFLFLRVAEDVPREVMAQIMKMAETGELTTPDGKFNYTREIPRLTLPVLFIAGKVDHSADPEAVRYAYEHVSSKDKAFRLFGLAWGDSIDYGHDDLILGKRAREEVYPVIKKWLEERARLAPFQPSGQPRSNPRPM